MGQVTIKVGWTRFNSQRSAVKWNIQHGTITRLFLPFKIKKTVSSASLEMVIPSGKISPVWILMKNEHWDKKVTPR